MGFLILFLAHCIQCCSGWGSNASRSKRTWDLANQIGTFNPSGLAHRSDVVAQLDGDFLGVTETHLSRLMFQKFVRGLRCQSSPFCNVIPGHDCPIRSRSEVAGSFTGVAAITKWPCRALPHDIPSDLYQTARIQVVGVCIRNLWVTVGILYGIPHSTSHLHPRYQTEQLLSSLIDRVGAQVKGPRIIMGDFNWERNELTELDRLESMGFTDLQQAAYDFWGQPVQATGRGKRTIDFVYVSRELLGLLESVKIETDQWPDHAAVSGTFRDVHPALERFHWKMPQQFDWPTRGWDIHQGPDPLQSATKSFASYWNKVEQVASQTALQHTGTNQSRCLGRGQTLATVKLIGSTAPVRKGRTGEIQPGFFGNSIVYSQIFKQARRLQSLVASLAKPSYVDREQLQSLWYKIRHSNGFPPGFCLWWESCDKPCDAPLNLSFAVPSHADAIIIFQVVQKHVQTYEKQLIKERVQKAKNIRASNLNYVFQDCAKAAPQPAEILVDSRTSQVCVLNHDDCSIVVDPPVKWIPALPICCDGVEIPVIQVEDDQIWLEKLEGIKAGDTLRQTKVHANVESVLQEFQREWSPKWNRLTKIVDGQWQQITDFAQRVLPSLTWKFRPWTLATFDGALKSKKARSAVGPDGISRKDLMAVPSSVRQHLLQFYDRIETSFEWPVQMTTGIVSALEKQSGALQTKNFRPIVIYSILTRIWSSVRARDFLEVFKTIAPEGLRGGIPARQSRSIWYELSMMLEQSNLANDAIIGIVVDLVKAFNLIPREVIWMALSTMKCPLWFIKSWASFVNCQTRRFRIQSSVGEAISSNVGYPEGCALSICAMGLIDMLLDWWLAPIDPSLTVLSYVDDWQIIHRDLGLHQSILQSLRTFVSALGMSIDESKSFVWATDGVCRSELRQDSLPVVLSAKELGAHMNFCLKRGNANLVKRIESMTHTWKQLRASLCPYKSKISALKILAWPRSLYGISTVHLGPLHFGKLRSNAMRGLRQARVGSSPVLHLPLSGFSTDPEGFAIFQTIKDSRELGDSEYLRNMLTVLSTSNERVPYNGPSSILMVRLSRLGWQITPDGFVHDRWNAFDIFTENIDSLKLRVAASWPWVLTAEVSHRKDFAGIQYADLAATAHIVSTFSLQDQVYLRCVLDGTLVTQKDSWKWDSTKDGSCPFCGSQDGYFHRAWECKHFADLRVDLPNEFWNWLAQMPPCVTDHAWVLQPASFDHLAKNLLAIPELSINDFRLECCSGPVIDLFTDGTCSDPTNHVLRLASWAITVAQPSVHMLANELVACGHIRGLQQTSFRAELTAIAAALQIADALNSQVRIWSDCQSAVNVTRRFQRGLARVRPNGSHADLWMAVQQLLQRCGTRVVLMQVYSHNDSSTGRDSVEQWAYWHNNLTDVAAGNFNRKRTSEFWQIWQTAKRDWEIRQRFCQTVAKIHVQVGRRADLQLRVPKEKKQILPQAGSESNVVQPRCYEITKRLLDKHGLWIMQQIQMWWHITGERSLGTKGQLRWISFIQLYVDFQLTTGHQGPTFLKNKWFPDASVFPVCDKPDWGAHCRWFQLVLKGYWKSNGLSIAVRSGPPDSSALAFWAVNAHLCWDENRMEKIDAAILAANGGVISVGKHIRDLQHFQKCTEMDVSHQFGQ